MGCNCKNALKIEERHGTEVEETRLQKAYRTLLKVFVLVIGLVLGVVLVPVIVFILLYNQFFRNGEGITIPKMLSKYIR